MVDCWICKFENVLVTSLSFNTSNLRNCNICGKCVLATKCVLHFHLCLFKTLILSINTSTLQNMQKQCRSSCKIASDIYENWNLSNIKFHKNLFSGSGLLSCGWTEKADMQSTGFWTYLNNGERKLLGLKSMHVIAKLTTFPEFSLQDDTVAVLTICTYNWCCLGKTMSVDGRQRWTYV
jgi:hypothetical protein